MSRIFENEPSVLEIEGMNIEAFPVSEAPDIDRAIRILGVNRPFSMRQDDEVLDTIELDDFFEMQRMAHARSGLSKALASEVWVPTYRNNAAPEDKPIVPSMAAVSCRGVVAFESANKVFEIHKEAGAKIFRQAIADQLFDGMYVQFWRHPVHIG